MPSRINKNKRKIKRRGSLSGKGRKGRPSKFTPKRRKLIYRAFEAGIPSKSRIAELVGIDRSLLEHWLDKGRDPKNSDFYAFRKRIMRIQAQREADLLATIEQCAHGGCTIKETEVKIGPKGKEIKTRRKEMAPQWQAAAWRLERWMPDDYGLRPVNLNVDQTPEDLAREIQQAAQALDASIPTFEDE